MPAENTPPTFMGLPIKFADDIPGGDIYLTNRLQVNEETYIEPRGDKMVMVIEGLRVVPIPSPKQDGEQG